MRFLFTVPFAGVVGSLIAAILMALVSGTNSDTWGLTINFSLIAMVFTIPGAALLVGLRALLARRGARRITIDGVTAATGIVVGGLFLGLLSEASSETILFGAYYGLTTAVLLILVEAVLRVWRDRRLG